MGQVSRNYWATVSAEKKRERARKSANARWNRSREWPSKSATDYKDRIPGDWLNRFTHIRSNVAVENPDCVSIEFDSELLNHMLDGFLAG
jgi:hypothetical protein